MMSGRTLMIGLLYDPRYAQAGWMLEVLAVAFLATPFQLAAQCYLALGMPQLLSRVLLVRLIALCVSVPLGFYFFGLHGALWGIVGSKVASLPNSYHIQRQAQDVRFATRITITPIGVGGCHCGVVDCAGG